MPQHTADLLSCWISRGRRKSKKKWWSIIPSCIWWCIWKERNSRCYDNKANSIEKVKWNCLTTFYFWCKEEGIEETAQILNFIGTLFCLSGSSDSMIRLWDLCQQMCVHSYAVHTDSVWALASTPTFSHVYSGGRDLSLYLTDLATRESVLLCTKDHPILQLALHGDGMWVATTDSS
ncbi:hypothetical protein H5410_040885, partial [Solanum commersonii]